MRKIIITLLLAIIGSTWTISNAAVQLPSLCDTWNEMWVYSPASPNPSYVTIIDHLTTDTIIGQKQYVKLCRDCEYEKYTNRYLGALREDNNANIYFIPAGTTHEYLLYAFNVSVGDTLDNVWLEDTLNIMFQSVTVADVQVDSLKTIVLNVKYTFMYNGVPEDYSEETTVIWRQGIGGSEPANTRCFMCGGGPSVVLLCAYKDGEQVYASKYWTKKVGCYYTRVREPLYQLPSLCDEWNLRTYTVVNPDKPDYHDFTQRLTTDTLIDGKRFRQLYGKKDYPDNDHYLGAIREGLFYYTPKDPSKPKYKHVIYFIPPQCVHEYLLYDFNAEVGDTLSNLWIGGLPQLVPNGITAVVSSISTTQPRIFDLQVLNTYGDGEYYGCGILRWIEGVGMEEGGVAGSPWQYCEPVDPTPWLICACKDHKVIYAENANCKCSTPHLNFLCDTWNILSDSYYDGTPHYRSFTQQLTTDTLINSELYVRLQQGKTYLGALREDDNANIYFIPAGTTHEYLLNAFNAQIGQRFSNLWIGGEPQDFPNGCEAEVATIIEQDGYTYIKLDAKDPNDASSEIWPYYWIEGIGLASGPRGDICPFACEGDHSYAVLCAYKDGEQVYDSPYWDWCYYDDTEQPADTIPLYFKDGPGSSTVDPVDPNQIVATLKSENLTIREFINEDITYSLSKAPASDQAPARRRVMQSDSFRESVTIPLIEGGTYEIELTNPEWSYSIVGTFRYMPAGVENTPATTEPAQKVLIDGRLFIMQGDKVYTLTGMQVE